MREIPVVRVADRRWECAGASGGQQGRREDGTSVAKLRGVRQDHSISGTLDLKTTAAMALLAWVCVPAVYIVGMTLEKAVLHLF
jgi:hypothetical protein